MMAARRILLLDSIRLTAWCWQGGDVRAEGEFTAEATGIEAFENYLRQHDGSLFYLLADVPDEGFQIEDLPAVSGSDRAANFKRKLGQYYYGTQLATTISLGRQKQGRRDERVLFTALTRPQHFEPWLEAITQTETILAGLFVLPQVTASIGAQLGKEHPACLLITLGRNGLRQTFFENGLLRFSRQTTLATGSIDESAAACATEATKIHQYLSGQRLIARDRALPVFVLCHPAQVQAIRGRCRDTDTLHFDTLDLLAEAGRYGLKTPLQDSRSEPLFAHLLVRNTPREQLVPAAGRHLYRIWQMRSALYGTGVIIFAGCLLFAGRQLFDIHRIEDATEQMRQQAGTDEQRYKAVLGSLPQIPLTTDNLRALTALYEELQTRSPGPEPLYRHIAAALGASPQIDIDRLDWAIVNRSDEAPGKISTGTPAPAQAQPATAGATAAVETGAFAAIDVHGVLPMAMATDPRTQKEAIEAFAARLKKEPEIRVRILSQPFDAESGKSIRSSGDAARVEAPRFSLRVTRKL